MQGAVLTRRGPEVLHITLSFFQGTEEMAESFPPGYEYPTVLVDELGSDEDQWRDEEGGEGAPLWSSFTRKDIEAESFPPGHEYPALMGGHRSEDSTFKALAPPARYSDQVRLLAKGCDSRRAVWC